jgi:hypothetical protein
VSSEQALFLAIRQQVLAMQVEAARSEQILAASRRARLLILTGAFLSFLFSIGLWFSGMRDEGLFVGLWVPSILALGSLVLPSNR